MSETRAWKTCFKCMTTVFRVDGIGDVAVDRDGTPHTVERCLDTASNRLRQLEHGRGASSCGTQWGMGGRNHGGGCGQSFSDAEDVYRCATCGGVFHKKCLEKHFAEHSGETVESLRAQLTAARAQVVDLRHKSELAKLAMRRARIRLERGPDEPAIADDIAGTAKSITDASEILRATLAKLETP